MNPQEALAWLHGTLRFGSKPGLRRVIALLERMGNPHKKLKFVHISGTNGKGSTAAMTESVLRHGGYKTGLFISPYLEDFRERMQVNRQLIPPDTLARLTTALRATVEAMTAEGGEHPSEFEMVTALAFQYFAEEQCDIVVLEVGLGGRLDSTNVIHGCEAAVFTSISLDHTEILGDTVAKIAYDKCGILKPGCEAVCCPRQAPEALSVLRQRCAAAALPLHLPEEGSFVLEKADLSGSVFRYQGETYQIGLVGHHQLQNALTVLTVVDVLRRRGFPLCLNAVKTGLLTARWAGRLEVVRQSPLCIIDGAHNLDAMRVLTATADSLLGGRGLIVVMGMLAKKNYGDCVSLLARRSRLFIATEAEDTPSPVVPAAELARLADEVRQTAGQRFYEPATVIPNPRDAAAYALGCAGGNDVILACGSLYMIGGIRRPLAEG